MPIPCELGSAGANGTCLQQANNNNGGNGTDDISQCRAPAPATTAGGDEAGPQVEAPSGAPAGDALAAAGPRTAAPARAARRAHAPEQAARD